MEVLLGARLRRPPAQAARDDGLGLRYVNGKTRAAADRGIPIITLEELVAMLPAGDHRAAVAPSPSNAAAAAPSSRAAAVPPLQLGAATSASSDASGPTARLPRVSTAPSQTPASPLRDSSYAPESPVCDNPYAPASPLVSPLDDLDEALPQVDPNLSRSRRRGKRSRRRRPPAGSEDTGSVRRSVGFLLLVEMGFNADAAEDALVDNDLNVDRAADSLAAESLLSG